MHREQSSDGTLGLRPCVFILIAELQFGMPCFPSVSTSMQNYNVILRPAGVGLAHAPSARLF